MPLLPAIGCGLPERVFLLFSVSVSWHIIVKLNWNFIHYKNFFDLYVSLTE